MSDISVEEAYRVMQAACGIGKGDKLRVLRDWEKDEMGFDGVMYNSETMQRFVGETCFADEIFDDHVTVKLGRLCVHVPFFVLKIIEKAKPEPPAGVIFETNGLTVAPSNRNTHISRETIRQNLDL